MKKPIILFVFCFIVHSTDLITNAQDSLHLVGTITGTDEQHKILSAKGIGDFNGDGLADFTISFLGTDTTINFNTYTKTYTNLYYGSTHFDTIPDFTFKYCNASYEIGDVNNDGHEDLMISEIDYSYYPPVTVFKIYGGGEALDTSTIFTYSPPYLWKMVFSNSVDKLGDINGDGYDDFAIASYYNWSDGRGRVYIFHGGDTLKAQPSQILSVKSRENGETFFGSSVTGIGDVNKDGYDDILISETSLDGDSGNVQLFYGGDELDTIPNRIFMPDEYDYGRELKNAGDLNKDGKTDFIVTSSGTNTYIYLSIDSVITIDMHRWGFGGYIGVGAGGDLNDDGYDDLLLSNTNYINDDSTMVGIVNLFYGGEPFDTLSDMSFEGELKWSDFGYYMDILGDINGDKHNDYLVHEIRYPTGNIFNSTGRVKIYSLNKIINDTRRKRSINIASFDLFQNYPNPFSPSTTIEYQLPEAAHVTIKLFNMLGEEVMELVNGQKSAGKYSVNFNAGNFASGIYIYTLQTGKEFIMRKMLLVK